MRTSPVYTDINRQALPPHDDDRMPIYQRDPKTGLWSQRWITREVSEERTLLIVDQDRAELTEQITGMVAAQAAQQKATDAIIAQQAALLAELAARKQMIALPDVTVTANQLLNLAGERSFTNLPCAGVRTTDTIYVAIKSRPLNVGLINWSIPANGRINLTVQVPLITLGSTPLVVTVTAFR